MDTFTNSKPNRDGEDLSPVQRRRTQNRLAQRRFREKAKLQKIVRTTSSQEGSAPLTNWEASGQQSEYEFSSLGRRPPDEEYAGLTWENFDENLLALPPNLPAMQEQQTQQGQSFRNGSLQKGDRVLSRNITTQEMQHSSLHFTEARGNPCYQGLGTSITQPAFPPNQLGGETTSDKDESQPAQSENGSVNSINHCIQSYECADSERPANAIIRNQKIQLCNEAEQLIEKTISIYDVGVLLGIIPSSPRLRQILSSAQESFRFQRSVELPSSDEVELKSDNE